MRSASPSRRRATALPCHPFRRAGAGGGGGGALLPGPAPSSAPCPKWLFPSFRRLQLPRWLPAVPPQAEPTQERGPGSALALSVCSGASGRRGWLEPSGHLGSEGRATRKANAFPPERRFLGVTSWHKGLRCPVLPLGLFAGACLAAPSHRHTKHPCPALPPSPPAPRGRPCPQPALPRGRLLLAKPELKGSRAELGQTRPSSPGQHHKPKLSTERFKLPFQSPAPGKGKRYPAPPRRLAATLPSSTRRAHGNFTTGFLCTSVQYTPRPPSSPQMEDVPGTRCPEPTPGGREGGRGAEVSAVTE